MIHHPLLNLAHSHAEQLKAILSFANSTASTIMHGYHKKKQAGMGSDFWQFKGAIDHTQASQIDWRQSAKTDTLYIKEHELESSRKISFALFSKQSMTRPHNKHSETKYHRAILIIACLSFLFKNSQDLFTAIGSDPVFKHSNSHIETLVSDLLQNQENNFSEQEFYKKLFALSDKSKIVFMIGDFFEDLDRLEKRLNQLGKKAVLIQTIHPEELDFPFKGAVEFETIDEHGAKEFLKTEKIRESYLSLFDEHQERLKTITKRNKALFVQHNTQDDLVPFLFELIERMNDYGV